jgi:CDP-paratose 2-epimerase
LKYKNILITGGAGFVGSNLAISLKRDYSDIKIIALDNLKRLGSELNITRLKDGGISFLHGDIRNREDLDETGSFDLIIECSAEPSVLSGFDGAPDYVLNTNLVGSINCFELARKREADIVFLSTSRVYPVEALNSLKCKKTKSRFELENLQDLPGASSKGISEIFPLDGARTLYGATKLCSELILQEYGAMYGVRGIINRCGVLTGPWQMGKVDQGVVVHWVARHIFGGNLGYFGYGGEGIQVRDLLHIEDFYRLLILQLEDFEKYNGQIYNVGGGRKVSVSLKELTGFCRRASGTSFEIGSVSKNREGDIPIYLSDCSKITESSGWNPVYTPENIIDEITRWVVDNKKFLEPILG